MYIYYNHIYKKFNLDQLPFNREYLEKEIIDQYLYDENYNRPWIIGFSGGKDSTMLLQLVWYALKKIPPELRTRKIHVVCNDTLVENPRIVQFIDSTLEKIQKASLLQNLPLTVHKTYPKLEDTFWVKLIGKGYPAPGSIFRWCTERLKINPTSKFILEKVSEYGEVIILLGTRSDESSNRAKSIKKHEIQGKRLRKHLLPNAYVYAPIKDVLIDDLWQYLLQAPPPWGGSNRELITLYRNANGGDCPLVIDDTTPSCGNSRFGCWVCTVISKDKSMEALIDNGEDWMQPLLDIRDYLAHTRDNPEIYRSKALRSGKIIENKWGPYLPEIRAEFLKRILIAQKELESEQGVQLISHQEMVAIQSVWYQDCILKPKVSEIYKSIYYSNIYMGKKDEKIKNEEKLLQKSCSDTKKFELIQDLISIQKSKALMRRKRGLQSDIDNRIDIYIKDKFKIL